VTHHYRCDADPEGYQWRVDLDGSGLTYAAQIDFETQWIYSIDLASGTEDFLEPDADDPASFSELLANDLDTWDFRTRDNDGTITRFRGFDRLTGDVAEIDGVALLRAEGQIEASGLDGDVQWTATGAQYISPEWRIFLFGQDTWSTPDGAEIMQDHTPVEFIFPGERGFLANTPRYDCNAELASYPLSIHRKTKVLP